jgi:hypothetical protein
MQQRQVLLARSTEVSGLEGLCISDKILLFLKQRIKKLIQYNNVSDCWSCHIFRVESDEADPAIRAQGSFF